MQDALGRISASIALGGVTLIVASMVACSAGREEPAGSKTPTIETDKLGNQSPTFEIRSGSDESARSRRDGIMYVENICHIADPAIDSAIADRGPNVLPLVSEIHAGLTSITNETVSLELAEGFTVGDNGLSYEFVLKPDLKFSDGSQLTASDFKWSWERALRKADNGGRASDALGWVKGAQTVTNGRSEELSGVKVVDDRTLIIELEHARSDFPALLADPVASVLNKENVSRWGQDWLNGRGILSTLLLTSPTAFQGDGVPVGAGPFRLIKYAPAAIEPECVLARNEHYWGQPAHLDGIRFIGDVWPIDGLEDDQFAYDERAFEEYRIDYVFVSPETADEVRQGTSRLVGDLKYHDPKPYSQFLIFNPSLPPFDDVHFRRAVVAASDISAMFDPFPIRWERRLIHPALTSEPSGVLGIEFSQEYADEELSQSKYAQSFDQFPVTYYSTSTGFVDDRFAKLLNSWNESIGFEVSHEHVTSGGMEVIAASDKLYMRQMDVNPEYPSPNTILRTFIDPFGKNDNSPELIELARAIEAVASEQDEVARIEMYEDIERDILEKAIALPLLLSWGGYNLLVQPWVRDFDIPKYPGSAFHDVWFDESSPARELE